MAQVSRWPASSAIEKGEGFACDHLKKAIESRPGENGFPKMGVIKRPFKRCVHTHRRGSIQTGSVEGGDNLSGGSMVERLAGEESEQTI